MSESNKYFTVKNEKSDIFPDDFNEDDVNLVDSSVNLIEVGDACYLLIKKSFYNVKVEGKVGNIITARCDAGFTHQCEVFGIYKQKYLLRSLVSVRSMKDRAFFNAEQPCFNVEKQ